MSVVCCGKKWEPHGLKTHNAMKHPKDLSHLYEKYPSLSYGENEWIAILTLRGDIFDRILNDMARTKHSKRNRPNI